MLKHSAAAPLIQVEGLNKAFGGKPILRDVSFEVQEGAITGLLGPNGSGKTTIIRLLCGVIDSDGGRVRVAGLDPRRQGDDIRRKVGIVTESASLYHDRSALDNLRFFGRIYGTEKEDGVRAERLLKQFDMWEHRDQKVGSFSTGMKKRVSLAKALLHRPKLLFLDEPTNGLDPEGIRLVMGYLKSVAQEENVTILICSHVLQQLETVCTDYLFIHQGRIVEQGTPEALERKYLQSVELLVETNVKPDHPELYQGQYPYRHEGEDRLMFTLRGKDEISPLLRQLLAEGWVHSCEIVNRSLETLYFQIGGERHES
jgi:ABC-2 type transport system ATP-binding protein